MRAMTLRTYRLLEQLRSAPFDLPSTLYETAVDRDARGEPWAVHHLRRGAREVWTLVLTEEGTAIQWQDGERHQGQWVAGRSAVKLEESRLWGLYGLDGRLVPQDPFDDEEQEDETL